MIYKQRSSYFAHRTPVYGSASIGSGVQKFTPDRALTRLRRTGSSHFDASKLRQHLHLTELLHVGEHVEAVVYGNDSGGLAIMALTDQRVLLCAKTPTISKSEEYTFDMVTGASCEQSGTFSTITLYTNRGLQTMRTQDADAAKHFVERVDLHRQVRRIDREMS